MLQALIPGTGELARSWTKWLPSGSVLLLGGDEWLIGFLSLAQTADGFQGPGQRKKDFGKPRTDLRTSENLDDIEPNLIRVWLCDKQKPKSSSATCWL